MPSAPQNRGGSASGAASAAPKIIPAAPLQDQSRCLRSLRVSIPGSWRKSPADPFPNRKRLPRTASKNPAIVLRQVTGEINSQKKLRPNWGRYARGKNRSRQSSLGHQPKSTKRSAVFAKPIPSRRANWNISTPTRCSSRALCEVADTPQKMLALGEDRVRDYIKTIGLYRNKAKNVIALSEKLIAEFGGQVPRTRAELESLPGAGRKSANVVLNMAFGEHTMAVDTHVFRVGNRTGLAPGKTPLEVELGLEKIIPSEFMLHAHHWLILHGRYTCLARKPRCEVCLISDLCRWPEKTVCGMVNVIF